MAIYEATLELKVSLREVLPPNHLARFVVDIISQLDLSSIYGRYAAQGGDTFTWGDKFKRLVIRVERYETG